MDEIIQSKSKILEQFVVSVNEYLPNIQNIKIEDPETWTYITKYLEELSVKINMPDNITKIVEIFDKFAKFDGYIYTIVEFIKNTQLNNNIKNMSETFTGNIMDKRNHILDLAEKYESFNNPNEYFNSLDIDINEAKKVVMNADGDNKFIVYLLHLLVNKLPEKEAVIVQKHADKLAKNILIKDYPNIKNNADVIKSMILRYGLIQQTESNSLENLSVKYFGYSFDELKKKYGVLIINKIYQHAINFEILNLIDAKYLLENNLLIPDSTALNSRVLKRLYNIRRYDNTSPQEKPFEYIPGKNGQTIIFQTLNGEDYFVISQSSELHTTNIAEVIMNGVSQLRERYNEIQWDRIKTNHTNIRTVNMFKEYDSKRKFYPDMGVLKTSIIGAFEYRWEKIPVAKNVEEFRKNALNREMTADSIASILFKKYEIDKSYHEQASSFIKDVDMIITRFYGALTGHVMESNIANVFNLQEGERKVMLRDKYRDIIARTFDTLNMAPSMWKEIEYSVKEYFIDNL